MEVKVGQWKRRNGVFYEIIEIDKNKTQTLLEYTSVTGEKVKMWKSIYWWDINPKLFTYADTPQELVQVGDLVEIYGDRILQIDEIDNVNKMFRFGDDTFVKLRDITAIYTPNENKTQYTEQWRKE